MEAGFTILQDQQGFLEPGTDVIGPLAAHLTKLTTTTVATFTAVSGLFSKLAASICLFGNSINYLGTATVLCHSCRLVRGS